jgi:hypothetical protein
LAEFAKILGLGFEGDEVDLGMLMAIHLISMNWPLVDELIEINCLRSSSFG